MKILKLSKNQQKKLLSLCEEFFPELQQKAKQKTRKDFSQEEAGFRLSNEKHNTLVYCSYPIDYDYHTHLLPNNQDTGIHWYQLCLTELPKRIYKKIECPLWNINTPFYNRYGYEDIHIQLVRSPHPVDFLVELVQICKKNKYFKKC